MKRIFPRVPASTFVVLGVRVVQAVDTKEVDVAETVMNKAVRIRPTRSVSFVGRLRKRADRSFDKGNLSVLMLLHNGHCTDSMFRTNLVGRM